MKIAGVSVNKENLPTKQELIRMALNTKKYQYDNNALESINKEIKKSGLYRDIPKGAEKADKPVIKGSTEGNKETGTPNNEA